MILYSLRDVSLYFPCILETPCTMDSKTIFAQFFEGLNLHWLQTWITSIFTSCSIESHEIENRRIVIFVGRTHANTFCLAFGDI